MANETTEELNKKLQSRDFMWAEMSPDLYDGKTCDEVRPRWHAQCDGDMESEYIDEVTLDPKMFPPGTTVIVSMPCCPRCDQTQEMCEAIDYCDFDWSLWRDNKYS